jgi:hypothetical protein
MVLIVITVPLKAQKQPATVGTFDRTAIVIAFYRSPLWAEIMKAKMQEQQRAKEANDIAKVQELNAWGGAQQELAHKQVMGEAPITNIVEALQPSFAEVERTAKVSQVVPSPYLGKAESVDVTNALLDCLKANERTRQIIRDVQNQNK